MTLGVRFQISANPKSQNPQPGTFTPIWLQPKACIRVLVYKEQVLPLDDFIFLLNTRLTKDRLEIQSVVHLKTIPR